MGILNISDKLLLIKSKLDNRGDIYCWIKFIKLLVLYVVLTSILIKSVLLFILENLFCNLLLNLVYFLIAFS